MIERKGKKAHLPETSNDAQTIRVVYFYKGKFKLETKRKSVSHSNPSSTDSRLQSQKPCRGTRTELTEPKRQTVYVYV